VIGLGLFLLSTTVERGGGSDFFLYRSLSFSLVALGLPTILYGFIIVLPLGDRATKTAFVGLAVSLLSIVGFLWAYPANWNVGAGSAAADYSTMIVGVYAIGLGIQVLAALIYPAATAGRLVEHRATATGAVPADSAADAGSDTESESDTETETETDTQAARDTPGQGKFELYRDNAGEYRWRFRHRNGNIIADSGEGYSSRTKAKQGLESVQKNVPGAAVEILADEAEAETEAETEADAETDTDTDTDGDDTDDGVLLSHDEDAVPAASSKAGFEIYEDRAGEYRWRLRHKNSNIIADGGQGFASVDGAQRSVDRVKSRAATADTLEYDPTGFEIYKDRAEEWRWRLRHKNGRILADSGEGYRSRSGAMNGIESVRRNVETGAEIYEDSAGKWRWRLVVKNGRCIADSGQGYSSKQGATQAFGRVAEYAVEADMLKYTPAAFEVYADKRGEFRWRLRHKNGQILADGGEGYSSRQKVRQGLESVRKNAGEAAVAVPPAVDVSDSDPEAESDSGSGSQSKSGADADSGFEFGPKSEAEPTDET